MCAGRIYYALDLGREERARDNIAIVRLEQLYPFPEAELTEILKRYPRASEFCWVQEEPANQGARDFVELRIERLLPGRRRLAYVGRGEAASPATGSHKIHQTEENDIVEAAPAAASPGAGQAVSLEVSIPPLGESVSEGTIARWLKRDGDTVKADEPLFELETDKATMEIPAPAAGRLEIVEREGATVRVGTVVARIAEAERGRARAARRRRLERPRRRRVRRPTAGWRRRLRRPAATTRGGATRRAAGGAAYRGRSRAHPEPGGTAHRAGRRAQLEPGGATAGHGEEPRSRRHCRHRQGWPPHKEDVLRHITERAPAAAPATGIAPPAASAPRAAERERAAGGPAVERVERVPMSRLRRRIAERLVEAQRTAAILTTFNEVDCSALMDVRRRHRERFKSTHGVDLGFMSLFARAVVLALADVPVVNARIDGDDIVYNHHVHLGIAVEHGAGPRRARHPPCRRDAPRRARARRERAGDPGARCAPGARRSRRRHLQHHQWRGVRLAALHAHPEPAPVAASSACTRSRSGPWRWTVRSWFVP